MYSSEYFRPANTAAAEKFLADKPDALLLSGGQTLIPAMKLRLTRPSHLVDVSHLPELQGLTLESGRLIVGAATRHAVVASSDLVRRAIPGLARLAGLIGDPAVRHMGTIGGSIANSDPAADYPAAAMGLGATIRTNRRVIEADDFFKGLFETALSRGEMITSVSFPVPRRSHYEKFKNRASHFALVGVYVGELANGSIRVAVTGASTHVFRSQEIEEALQASFTPEAVNSIRVDARKLSGDLHASPEYRAHLISVLAARAVQAMTSRAG